MHYTVIIISAIVIGSVSTTKIRTYHIQVHKLPYVVEKSSDNQHTSNTLPRPTAREKMKPTTGDNRVWLN
jgi:hypothetical protein